MGWRSKIASRRRYIVVVTTALFLAAAGAFSAVRPRLYEASAKVAVRQTSGNAPSARPGVTGSAALTEAEVVGSDGVLDLAANKLGVTRDTKSDELKRSLVPEVVHGTDVLEIKVRRPAAHQSADWANAIAESYVEYRRISMVDNAAATGGVISRAIQADNAKIAELQSQIRSSPANEAELRAEERRLAARVRNLQTQLLGLTDSEALRHGGATLIDLADFPTSPSAPNWPRDLGLAGASGLLAGILFSLVAKPPQLSNSRRRKAGGKSVSGSLMNGDFDRMGKWLDPLGKALVKLDSELVAIPDKLRTQQADLTGRMDKVVGKLDAAVREDRLQMAELNHEILQRLGTVDLRLTKEMGQLREELLGRVLTQDEGAAQHADILRRIEWLAASFDRESAAASERVEDIFGRVSSQLATQESTVSDALQAVKRETLDEVREERMQMAELNHEMTHRLGRVAVRVSEELQQLREEALGVRSEIAGRVMNRQAELAEKLDSIATRLDGQEPAVARLEGVITRIGSQLAAQPESLSKALEQVKRSLAVEVREDLRQVAERMTSEREQLLQRLTKFSMTVGQGMEKLREEGLEKILAAQERMTGIQESIEGRLDADSKMTSGLISGMISQLTAQSREIQTGMSQAINRLDTSLVEKADITRVELVQRVSALDAEGAQRLGEVTARLSDSLTGLRDEVSRKLDFTESALAEMLGKLESRRKTESSDIGQRLNTIDEEFAERLARLAASIKNSLTDLRGRVSEELSDQHADLSVRLESLEAKVAESTAGANKRVSARLKSVEESVSELASQLNEPTGRASRGPVVPIGTSRPRAERGKGAVKPRSASGKKSG